MATYGVSGCGAPIIEGAATRRNSTTANATMAMTSSIRAAAAPSPSTRVRRVWSLPGCCPGHPQETLEWSPAWPNPRRRPTHGRGRARALPRHTRRRRRTRPVARRSQLAKWRPFVTHEIAQQQPAPGIGMIEIDFDRDHRAAPRQRDVDGTGSRSSGPKMASNAVGVKPPPISTRPGSDGTLLRDPAHPPTRFPRA